MFIVRINMNDRLIDKLKGSKGKRVHVFLKNGFHYEGIINGSDETWLELYDFKIRGTKIIRIEDISNLNIYGEEE